MYSTNGTLLEACVLGCLAQSPAYGYRLTQRVQGSLGVSESTLYPVLRRLQKDGLLITRDEAIDGRNRRYYALTDEGEALLSERQEGWTTYRTHVDAMILGGMTHE